MSSQDLFGVVRTNGTFYQGILPDSPTSTDDWIKSAKIIGESGWSHAWNLLFHPDGTLYGSHFDPGSTTLKTTDTRPLQFDPATEIIYKAPPPTDHQPVSFSTWLTEGTSVWSQIATGLIACFDPDGRLYIASEDTLCTVHSNSATPLGKGGWSAFKFLFYDPEGFLYGVEKNDKFHKRSPPTAPDDDWLATSTLIGTAGWSDFQFLFFMSSSEMYGVYQDKFYKGSPPSQSIDAHTWMASSKLIGSSGWSQFAFLVSPLRHE